MICRFRLFTILMPLWLTAICQTAAPRPTSASEPDFAVIRVNHVPAADLAEAIIKLLASESKATSSQGGEGAARAAAPTIVSESLTNSLLVRAEPATVQRIEKLVADLDRKPRAVFVEVVIVAVESAEKPERVVVQSDERGTADAVVEALAQQGEVQVLARTQLMSLNNQPAYIQLGQGKPRVTGVSSTGRGTTRQVSVENVGLVLGLTPRVSPDETVTIEVDLERSGTDPENRSDGDSATGDSVDLGVSSTRMLSLQTTICARDAQTVILGGLTERQGETWRRLVTLLTPRIIDQP